MISWARSEVVITPPCHGGDRRFKSGRARQALTLTNYQAYANV
jgi:hypothetical protein